MTGIWHVDRTTAFVVFVLFPNFHQLNLHLSNFSLIRRMCDTTLSSLFSLLCHDYSKYLVVHELDVHTTVQMETNLWMLVKLLLQTEHIMATSYPNLFPFSQQSSLTLILEFG